MGVGGPGEEKFRRQKMGGIATSLAAIRPKCFPQYRAALRSNDESLALELGCDSNDAAHVLGVVNPISVARTKLFDAASVGIDDRAGRSVGALVVVVRHAVPVAVRGQNLAAKFPVGEAARADVRIPKPCQQLAGFLARQGA